MPLLGLNIVTVRAISKSKQTQIVKRSVVHELKATVQWLHVAVVNT